MRDLLHAAFDGLSDNLKATVDTVSVLSLVGALVQILPAIASLLTVIWTALRIYETTTVQRWLHGPDAAASDDVAGEGRHDP
ncbi:hypothetical protein [Novosphingobium sp. EMRT-2]|uniref:hypothetical protein n=1 Tax=Novosphingobium sp. EMRT-2 TaxID=2571749 RepID=UPI0010BDFBFA|nr:hypothetical protein [Novosphingobium sp. EMRT-2]QCI92323.1 hypothetical protein FA702_01225 [Novosphingobium sp. EMRT-2]